VPPLGAREVALLLVLGGERGEEVARGERVETRLACSRGVEREDGRSGR